MILMAPLLHRPNPYTLAIIGSGQRDIPTPLLSIVKISIDIIWLFRISHNVSDFLFAIQEIGKDPLMLSRPSPIWVQSKVDGIILWPGRMDGGGKALRGVARTDRMEKNGVRYSSYKSILILIMSRHSIPFS
jgi:hypothetical protein